MKNSNFSLILRQFFLTQINVKRVNTNLPHFFFQIHKNVIVN